MAAKAAGRELLNTWRMNVCKFDVALWASGGQKERREKKKLTSEFLGSAISN
jgi:hypothetical protein